MTVTKAARLADEIRRSVSGDPWYGPSFGEALRGIDFSQAQRRPAESAHSIWEITLHVFVWHRELLAVVRGQPYRTKIEIEQWPTIDGASEPTWNALTQSIDTVNSELASEVGKLADRDLARRIENRDYDLEFLLHGFAQHNAYHAGQIALLKRFVA